MTDARESQLGLDAVVDPDPDARASQVGLDAVVDTGPDARVTQVGVDAVIDTGPAARVTQVGLDAIVDTAPAARLSQLGIDVIWKPKVIPTPPSSDFQGVGYADLVLHTPFVIDHLGNPVVTGGDTVIDAALDTVVDANGDIVGGNFTFVIASSYWT